MIDTFELHHSPHRHYKALIDPAKGKWSWSIRKQRIVSVTSVLDESGDRLWQWAVGQAYLAGERIGGCTDLASLAWDQGLGPEAIRDKAALLGTASHEGLAALAAGEWRGAKLEASARADKLASERRLAQQAADLEGGNPLDVPPPVREADLWPRFVGLEQFWSDHRPDTQAAETIVGSERYVYAGTFDWFGTLSTRQGNVLLDAKNTNLPSWRHAVQVAAYESARREMGHDRASHLLVLYLTPYGTYKLLDAKLLGGYGALRRTFLSQLRVVRAQRKIDAGIAKWSEA